MVKQPKESRIAGVGDAAVKARTGRTWGEWIAILDRAGARRLSHPEIVAILHRRYRVGPWWQQMLTVGYEQARGLRQKHQTARGYQASVSRTLPVPLSGLYRAWAEPSLRSRWLRKTGLVVRKATVNRSLRLAWPDARSRVDVEFYSKGRGRSQVTVTHSALKDAAEVARSKAFWAKALEALKRVLAA